MNDTTWRSRSLVVGRGEFGGGTQSPSSLRPWPVRRALATSQLPPQQLSSRDIQRPRGSPSPERVPRIVARPPARRWFLSIVVWDERVDERFGRTGQPESGRTGRTGRTDERGRTGRTGRTGQADPFVRYRSGPRASLRWLTTKDDLRGRGRWGWPIRGRRR